MNQISYVFWEMSLLTFGWALARLAFSNIYAREEEKAPLFLAVALAGKLLLNCFIPWLLVILKIFSSAGLFLGALAALGGAAFMFRRSRAGFKDFSCPLSYRLWAALALLAAAGGLPAAIGPLHEVDSTNIAFYLLRLTRNEAGIFDNPFSYSSIWELCYLPNLFLTGLNYYFPFVSVQAVIFFALLAFLLARYSGLGPGLAGLAALVFLLGGHFWSLLPTGTATLKNDAVYNAGLLAIIIAFRRMADAEAWDRPGLTLLTFGFVFGVAKSSGPALAGAFIFWTALFHWPALKKAALAAWRPLSLCALISAALGGVYYIHNWLAFGNPLYPMNFKPFGWPGRISLETSIPLMKYIAEPEMWRHFFQLESCGVLCSYSGFFTPFLNLFSLIAAPVLVLAGKNFPGRKNFFYLYALTATQWLVFFNQPWSAGLPEIPFAYIAQHNTLRYVLAASACSWTLWLMALARGGRFGLPAAVLSLAVELFFRVRFIFIYGYLPIKLHWFWPFFFIALAAGGAKVLRDRAPLPAAGLWLLILVYAAPGVYRINLLRPYNQGVNFNAQYAADEFPEGRASSRIYALDLKIDDWGELSSKFHYNAFAASGSNSQFEFEGYVGYQELSKMVAGGGGEALVVLTMLHTPFTGGDLKILRERLGPLGYVNVVNYPCSALFFFAPGQREGAHE